MADQGESPITISKFNKFLFTGLPDGGSQYFFRIQAFDLSGNLGELSNETTTTISTSLEDEVVSQKVCMSYFECV